MKYQFRINNHAAVKAAFQFVFILLLASGCFRDTQMYTVSDEPWPESFGNHRAVLEVEGDEEAVHLVLPWRRHDPDPQERMLLLIDAGSLDTISNIHRIRLDREVCEIIAGPVKAGTHYLYYLPFKVQEGYGFYNNDYLPREGKPDPEWMEQLDLDALPPAALTRIEARTAMDHFFPMEIIPFASEKAAFLEDHPDSFLLFTEDRLYPVRMMDEIPLRWIQKPQLNQFEGVAQCNEYYVFQVAVFAARADVVDLQVSFTGLEGPGGASLGTDKLTCFNTEGVDTYGNPFEKKIRVREGCVQALWMGVDIPEDIRPGTYRGKILIGPAEGEKQEVILEIKVKKGVLKDRGDAEPWRHSRLRWLNSTAGLDDHPVAPYSAIKQPDNFVAELTGKKITVGAAGLPESILVVDTEVLNRSMIFTVYGDPEEEHFSAPEYRNVLNNRGKVSGEWTCQSEHFQLSGEGALESDGYLRYRFQLKAMENISLQDIRLEIPFRREMAEYMIGMGLPGTAMPRKHKAKWEGPEDSFWIGNTRGGLWVELRGSDYHGPLLNLYHPSPPASWHNQGKGGFSIDRGESEVVATVFSGERELVKGDELSFEFALLVTPVKDLNPASQFRDRYFHNAAKPDPGPEDLEAGIRIVNLHHANAFNPYINYPFKAVEAMKSFVERNHQKGLRVKIYYTIRELTNHVTEIWALRSLGDEIFENGPGGGYPWLREHLVSGYRPQWYQHSNDTTVDASILTAAGESRWINYYIEGLGWLVRNVDIDGLYLDDVSFDRHILKRMKKVMEAEKPGCIIDLHSNTGFSKGPAKQYAEYFPYVDKLWYGESFMYNEMSYENWLVEVSGIPFGLMGDMLHGGGNPWLGMVFGMTTRLPWTTEGVLCDPVAIWKIWDEFGIEHSRMTGPWELDPVVETDQPDVKATAYLREDSVLISVGNFSDDPHAVKLQINWDRIGMDPDGAILTAPGIEDFQESQQFEVTDRVPVQPRKGYLLYLAGKTGSR
jgi:hypothetical protein